MKNSHHGPAQRAQTLFARLLFSLVVILVSVNTMAQQWVMNYESTDELKHYTTKVVPGASDECAMAGTIFSGGIGKLHFLRLDNQGNILISKEYASSYAEERVVDLQSYMDASSNVYWYVVCQVRNSSPAKDMVRVLCLDDNGVIIDQEVYDDGMEIYPMHSTTWTNGTDERLYICGYVTNAGTSVLPTEPDYTINKQAFVFAVDINPSSMTHLDRSIDPGTLSPIGMLYDWNNNWGSTLDYDMAMRIIVIQGNNDLFVTGSVNGLETIWFPPSPKMPDRSATMNLRVDPNTLAVNSDYPFLHNHQNNDDQSGPNDYGVDLIQVNGNNYVLANMATPDYNSLPASAQSMSAPRLWKRFYVQSLDGLYNWSTGWDWLGNAEIWAAHAMETGGNLVTLATLVYGQYATCIPLPNTPSSANVNVNLITVDFTSTAPPATLTGGPNRIFMTNTSTSNFWTLGGALSNVDFPPTFADLGSSQYVFSAPKEVNGVLNMKYTDPDLGMNLNCGTIWDGNASPCDWFVTMHSPPMNSYLGPWMPTFTPTPILGNSMFPAQTWVTNSNFGPATVPNFSASTANTYSIPAPSACIDQAGNPSWKATTVKNAGKAAVTRLYPNPANDILTLEPAGDIASNTTLRVSLQNILGQEIVELYNGATKASVVMTLPDVPGGVYYVQVYADGKSVLREKLTINK